MSYNKDDLIHKLNSLHFDTRGGIIESLLVINDCVYAIIKKNYSSILDDNGRTIDVGDGYFNCVDGRYIGNYTLPELLIRTDIEAFNSNISRYIGKPCRVILIRELPVHATVDMGSSSPTVFDIDDIKNLRRSVGSAKSIFDYKDRLKTLGLTDTNIEDLADCKYDESYKEKLITIEGEGTWYRDTSNPITNEIVLKSNSIWLGVNSSGMNDKKYHIPTKVFSGK